MANITNISLSDLANFNRQEITLDRIIDFIKNFKIGGSHFFNFPCFKIAINDFQCFSPLLCLNQADATLVNAQIKVGYPNVAASIHEGRQVIFSEEDIINAKAVDVHDEHWKEQLKKLFNLLSREARDFLFKCGSLPICLPSVVHLDEAIELKDVIQISSVNEFINKKFAKVTQRNQCFVISEAKDKKQGGLPRIIFSEYFQGFSTIQDEIYTKFYILPYLHGAESTWQHVRICGECKNLFFFKQERARYCSQKCRMDVANRVRRKK